MTKAELVNKLTRLKIEHTSIAIGNKELVVKNEEMELKIKNLRNMLHVSESVRDRLVIAKNEAVKQKENAETELAGIERFAKDVINNISNGGY